MIAPESFSCAVKRVEPLSTTGVFVLGADAGTWFSALLTKLMWVLLAGGGVMHAVAMYGKHRAEIALGMQQPLWHRLLYWLCWGLLAVLVTSLVVARG